MPTWKSKQCMQQCNDIGRNGMILCCVVLCCVLVVIAFWPFDVLRLWCVSIPRNILKSRGEGSARSTPRSLSSLHNYSQLPIHNYFCWKCRYTVMSMQWCVTKTTKKIVLPTIYHSSHTTKNSLQKKLGLDHDRLAHHLISSLEVPSSDSQEVFLTQRNGQPHLKLKQNPMDLPIFRRRFEIGLVNSDLRWWMKYIAGIAIREL